jgi:hypothetical protein
MKMIIQRSRLHTCNKIQKCNKYVIFENWKNDYLPSRKYDLYKPGGIRRKYPYFLFIITSKNSENLAQLVIQVSHKEILRYIF